MTLPEPQTKWPMTFFQTCLSLCTCDRYVYYILTDDVFLKALHTGKSRSPSQIISPLPVILSSKLPPELQHTH